MRLFFIHSLLFFTCFYSNRQEIEVRRDTGGYRQAPSAASSAYLLRAKMESEIDQTMRQLRDMIEVLQHELDMLKRDVDKLNSNMSLETVRIREEIAALKKTVAKQKEAPKSRGSDGQKDKDRDKDRAKSKPKESIKPLVKTFIDQREQLKKVKELIKDKKIAQAIVSIDSLISSFPKSELISYFYYYKGVCLYSQKKYDDALFNFSEAYNRNRKGAIAGHSLNKLAACFKAQGQEQRAKVVLEKLKMDFPDFRE